MIGGMPAGYDAWKTQSGYDDRDTFPSYDDEPEDECDHEEYETDILTGRAECCKCPHSWYVTPEQEAAERERIREYAEWERRQQRREFWRRLTYPVRWPVYRVLNRIWPRKACRVLTDDEIPF